jgi:hypothetical protein
MVVIGIADLMVRKIFVVTEIMAGDMVAAVDSVAREMMAHDSMPVKRVGGECMRAKRVAHMDRSVGREAMETMEAAKASMHAAERRMESTAAHVETTAATSASTAKVEAAGSLRHCRDIGGKAQRADRNAGRQNRYRSFHGRFPIIIAPAAATSEQARIQRTLLLNCSHPMGVSRWRQDGFELIFRNRCSAKARRPQIAATSVKSTMF